VAFSRAAGKVQHDAVVPRLALICALMAASKLAFAEFGCIDLDVFSEE
jgi:hypothetical protein